jgi:arabinose-5-phosphate isomerase
MDDYIESVRKTINDEGNAILKLASTLDESINEVITLILNCRGRVILSGMGKSALIAQKIVATLNSTGTSSLFMHAADALHGDLGIVSENDLVFFLSKSGDTAEIKSLIPILSSYPITIIGMSNNPTSYLAQHAKSHIYIPITDEADPNNLAPTTSTTLQLVLGDAIAVGVLTARGFTPEMFKKFHPGGNLGKQLTLLVGEIINTINIPHVTQDSSLNDVIISISSGRMGATVVLDDFGLTIGIITDGDLRRMLAKDPDLKKMTAKEMMTQNPKSILYDAKALEAFNIMRSYSINQLVVKDEKGRYQGILHIHDLINRGFC